MWINDIDEGLAVIAQVVGAYKCTFEKITGSYHCIIFWMNDTDCYVWSYVHKVLWKTNAKTNASTCLYEDGKIKG